MAKQAIIEVAKSGKDLATCDVEDMALYSPMFLPKVYAVKELVPDVDDKVEYEHNLGYPPMYLYYEQQEYFQDNPASEHFVPNRFVYGSQGTHWNMTDEKFYSAATVNNNAFIILFLDPLADPTSEPNPTAHGSPRIKVGSDLENDADYKAEIDTKYQTLKVHMQDQFVCNVPEHNAPAPYADGWLRYDWFSFNHNLGFPPVHTPFINTVGLSLDLAYDNSIPSDFIVNDVNDMMAEKWAYQFGWSGNYHEGVWVYVDINKYYVGYRRQNWDSSAHTFPARTVRVNYTIFNLPINVEFNLLS